jgi:large subunit ribosomal protein L4
VLVVAHRDDEITWKSLRNVPGVHVLTEDQLNTYDVLASDYVVFTEQALTAFVGRARTAPEAATSRSASSRASGTTKRSAREGGNEA